MKDYAPPSAPVETIASPKEDGTPPNLLTFRIIGLLDLLRRSGTLANRREFGLTGIEWRIMAQVGEHAPLSLHDLTELLNLDPGQLSRTVKGLVGRGLLDSRRRPTGPAIMITLTGEGQALHVRMMELARERNGFLVAGINVEDVAVATRVLDMVIRNAQLLLEKEGTATPPA